VPLTRLALRCMTSPFPDYMIARAIGVPAPTFSNCTLGRDRLNPVLLMDLSYLLGCQPEHLVGWANDGHDTPRLDGELPCLDTGLDTARPGQTAAA
jgi:hypothetical protein